MERKELIVSSVEKHKDLMLDAEKYLWCHPQTGFNEWQAHEYLKEKFESLGYNLIEAGNIPGFYTDIDTGIPGPTLYIMGELDALDIANHPQSIDGVTHCCGHHAQGATLLGIAAALKEDGMIDGMAGKIRLIATPAEEMIQLSYRDELRKKGVISYITGKVELMKRGFFDERGLSLMIHTNTNDDGLEFKAGPGSNGCIIKILKYKGKATHAGAAPHLGINAQYAATLGLQACNDLRETFKESDFIKFHPIMKGVNCAVNIIPDEMEIESYVRGKTVEAISYENKKLNRALAGAAVSMGAMLEIHDRHSAAPELHSEEFMRLAEKCCSDLVGEDKVEFLYEGWGTACSDFGDLTAVMPGLQFNAAGGKGVCHSVDFEINEPWRYCKNSASAQLLIAYELLCNNCANAENIIEKYTPPFSSIDEYFKFIDTLMLDCEAVTYAPDGTVTVKYM